MLGVDGWVQGSSSQRGAQIDSRPTQQSLRKQPRGPRRKQVDMGDSDHSWHSERSTAQSLCSYMCMENMFIVEETILKK